MSGPKTKLASTRNTAPDRQTEGDKTAKRQKKNRIRWTQGDKKGVEEEKQSEAVIRLQSILLSDLFGILNRGPDTPKQKMKR